MKTKGLSLLVCGLFLSSSFCFSSCTSGGQIHVYAPDGAPALALAKLLSEDRADDGISYTVTGAENIRTLVTGRNLKADVCILPVNQASILLGDGSNYQMVGLATHGNMYLLSSDPKQYNRDNVEDLKGKKIGVIQYANVPGLTLRATLGDLSIPYVTDKENLSLSNVYLQGITKDEVLPDGKAVDLYLCPEPLASTKIKASTSQGKPFYMVGDLQELYGGTEGYPQACIVAKKSFIIGNPTAFSKIMQGIDQCETYLASAEISTICHAVSSHLEKDLTASFSTANLTHEVIARSNVRFVPSEYCYTRVNDFLQKLSAVSVDSARPVEADFYYFGV